jgi:hypothetical protein
MAARLNPLTDSIWHAMFLQVILRLSQTQGWSWPTLWWMFLVSDRSEHESEMVRAEGLHYGLAAWAGRHRQLYRLRFWLYDPFLVHWALHHGCKVGASWAMHVWRARFPDSNPFFSVSNLGTWAAGLGGLGLLRWQFGSTTLVRGLISRAIFPSELAWPELSWEGCLVDKEWLWYTVCHLCFWLGGPRARPRILGACMLALGFVLVVDCSAGKAKIWDLVFAAWHYSWASLVVIFVHFFLSF